MGRIYASGNNWAGHGNVRSIGNDRWPCASLRLALKHSSDSCGVNRSGGYTNAYFGVLALESEAVDPRL